MRSGILDASILIATAVLVALTNFGMPSLLSSSFAPTAPWVGNHPNVPLRCAKGLVVADHHCRSACPIGFSPVEWSLGEPPVCMSSDNHPFSLYDLAGVQVSSDNGFTVYRTVSNIPLEKYLITSQEGYSTYVYLRVSNLVMTQIPTVLWYPSVTTEVATVGDKVAGTFLILAINPDSVQGNYSQLYPVAYLFGTPRTIHIGDDIGVSCLGQSETVQSIDSGAQTVAFRAAYTPPTGSCPVCLSGNTMIQTPTGEVNVKTITVGTNVWTMDRSGNRIVGIVVKTGQMAVPPMDMIVHLVLGDGRELYASVSHPTADGRTIGQLKPGNFLDNSIVKIAELVPYTQPFTYDLLPDGGTGFYWANDILVGSTLQR